MPHLQTLDGQPLSWPELLQRNAEWHATHDKHGDARVHTFVPVVACYVCAQGRHHNCSGRARVAEVGPVDCSCAQNGHAK